MAVLYSSERKLAKRISVQCSICWKWYEFRIDTPLFHFLNHFLFSNVVFQGVCLSSCASYIQSPDIEIIRKISQHVLKMSRSFFLSTEKTWVEKKVYFQYSKSCFTYMFQQYFYQFWVFLCVLKNRHFSIQGLVVYTIYIVHECSGIEAP